MKDQIKNWIHFVESLDGIPPKEVLAFNFNVFESTEGILMYLVGSFDYSEKNEKWAKLEAPDKAYRYIRLPDELQDAKHDLIVDTLADVLAEMEEDGLFKKGMLKNAKAICCSFENETLVKIR